VIFECFLCIYTRGPPIGVDHCRIYFLFLFLRDDFATVTIRNRRSSRMAESSRISGHTLITHTHMEYRIVGLAALAQELEKKIDSAGSKESQFQNNCNLKLFSMFSEYTAFWFRSEGFSETKGPAKAQTVILQLHQPPLGASDVQQLRCPAPRAALRGQIYASPRDSVRCLEGCKE
jgi:hypothetical protein